MTQYPNQIDNDLDILRIENNLTAIGAQSINALRDAMFAVQETLGANPQGTKGTIVDFLDVSFNSDGTLKTSVLTGAGLVTLPITNSQIAAGAGIVESKLSLDYSTSVLNATMSSLGTIVSGMNTVLTEVSTDFVLHIYGEPTPTTTDGYVNRHVASHVDINNGEFSGYPQYTGVDPRDNSFINSGLYDLDGYIRDARTVMNALIEINNDLLTHALSTSTTKHTAEFIEVDTSQFTTIPSTKTNVQLALDFIDDFEAEIIETHRLEQHSNGIPRASRVERYEDDGYNTILGTFECATSTTSGGLGKVLFTATPGDLDWAFRQLVPGDFVQINYGGYFINHKIDTITYTPNTTYNLTIDGYVATTTTGLYGLLSKSKYDSNHYGVLGLAPANHNYYSGTDDASVPGSAIVISSNCASATGIDFSADDLDSTHYMLYISYYPTGDPSEVNIAPPSIIIGVDVTGNLGITPGKYSLQHVIKTTNRIFRSGGYNYRFVAFEYKGQFGIALADVIDNAAFSIVSGTGSGTTIIPGSFINNVIGDSASPVKDALGLGFTKANVASPSYQVPSATSIPTQVIARKVNKKYNIDGQYIDYLQNGHLTNANGYYDGYLKEVQTTSVRSKGVYRVSIDLQNTELKIGSTIIVYPSVDRAEAEFIEQDYGRYIVEDLTYGCTDGGWTDISVISCVSLSGNPIFIASVPPPDLPVRIYFSEDSVTFENNDGDTYRNLFEVFVTTNGKTFSHKRARLPLKASSNYYELNTQLGTGNIDDGYGWHIADISPKFKGFFPLGAAVTDLKKFIRFVITNYNSTDDSYDCRIGQPGTIGNIINEGPITRVRKGDIGRFYDNSGDYIELRFTENIFTTALDISVPATEWRYADIEIFETMRLNEEQMCLAVCEQTSSGAVKTFLDNFVDKRQFGTVSEKDLSTTAIQFIEASDRLFHQNGVYNGFEYIEISGNNLIFNGGTAIINGTIVNINNFTVYPFKMETSSPPTTVNYAVCLKSNGTYELVAIDITSSTQDYTIGREKVYTLNEIIITRKDLLPLWIFTAITDGIILTVSSQLKDIRKFINNTGTNTPLTLIGQINENDSTYGSDNLDVKIGNFASWDAVSNYIKYGNKINSTILVKGDTIIHSVVDFGQKPVTIKGESGNIVRCASSVSIALYSEMTIDGINFTREYDKSGLDYYSSGFASGTLAFIVSEAVILPNIFENINILNCTFDTTTGYQASGDAHILFEETGPSSFSIFRNINICKNIFKESLAPQLDIAFVNKSSQALLNPISYTNHDTILNTVTIEGNSGGHDSWIMLSSDNYDSGSGSSRGLSAYGVRIINNNFTHIWYNLSRYVTTGFNGFSYNFEYNKSFPIMNAEFDVINNSFNDIMNRAIDGTLLGRDGTFFSETYKEVKVASPSMNISNNRCASIAVSINGDVYNDGTYDYPKGIGAIQITNNILQSSPYNGIDFDPTSSYASNADLPFGIVTYGNMTYGHEKKNLVKISDNIISNEMQVFDPSASPTYNYDYPIFTSIPCDIQNNIISECISETGVGICLNCIHPTTVGHGDDSYIINVTNNTITRASTTIFSYIYITGDDKIKTIGIKDNTFDGYTVTDTPTTIDDHESIKYSASTYDKVIAQRNIGQMFYTDLIPNINSNITGFYNVISPSSSDRAVGWRPASNSTFDGSYFSLENSIATNLDSAAFASGTYYVSPLIINLPSYDGASGLSLSFSITGTTSPHNNIRIYASTQSGTNRSLSVADPTTIIYPVRNITNSVDNYFVSDATAQSIHIKIDDIYNTHYTSYKSTDKYFPLYLYFVEESSPLTPISMVKASAFAYEIIQLNQILGQFRY